MSAPSSRPAPPADPGGSRALLASLLGDTLDPGYAAAAARRDRDGARRTPDSVARPLVAVGALLVGLLLAVAYLHTDRAAPADARTRQDLIARVRGAGAQASSLAVQAGRLGAAVNARRDDSAGGRSLSLAEAAAGTTAVHGPGVRISLGDAPSTSTTTASGRPGSTPLGETSVLTDIDVRAVVNELWKDGAEAIAVNGVRLTPTSAIRFAGQAVLVDLQPVTPPYVIAAIGDRDGVSTAFTSSAVAARYRTRASAAGYDFSVHTSDRLELPAATAGRPRYASVPGSPTPSTPSRGSNSSGSNSSGPTSSPTGGRPT